MARSVGKNKKKNKKRKTGAQVGHKFYGNQYTSVPTYAPASRTAKAILALGGRKIGLQRTRTDKRGVFERKAARKIKIEAEKKYVPLRGIVAKTLHYTMPSLFPRLKKKVIRRMERRERFQR
jgi:hypothetical protein